MKIDVFRLIDVQTFQTFAQKTKDQSKALLNYYEKTGKLIKIKRGVYLNSAYAHQITPYEISNFCFANSYISLENILYEAGIIKQYSLGVIQSVSPTSKTQEFNFGGVVFRNYCVKLKHDNEKNFGLIIGGDSIGKASKERALLDLLYLKIFSKNYCFDNELYLDTIDALQLEKLSKMYGKRLEEYVKKNVLGKNHLFIR